MIVKKHFHNGRMILAACDKSIFKEKIEDKKIMLDLSSEFYNGDEMGVADFIALAKKAYIINAVGKETIDTLIKAELVDKENIRIISGTPHTQVLREG